MRSESFEASIILTARDRISATLSRIDDRLGGVSARAATLTRTLAKTAAGMAIFQGALIGLSAVIPALITAAVISSLKDYEDAARRARFQLRLMGLSAFDVNSTVESLSRTVDRATAISLLGSADAMSAMTLAGFKLSERLIPLTEKLSDITGIRPDIMFEALVKAVTERDFSAFNDLVTGMKDMVPASAALSQGDLPGFFDRIDEAVSGDTVSRVQKLADNLARISLVTRPTREAIAEDVAGFLNVLIAAFAERADAAEEDIRLVLATSFSGAFASASRFLAVRFTKGFLAGVATLLILDMGNTLTLVSENPEVLASLAIVAATVGRTFGKNWASAFIVASTLLLPGIIDTFKDMEGDDVVVLAAAAAGFLIGRKWRLGFLASLALGQVLADVFSGLVSGEDIAIPILKATVVGSAILIGLAFGGPMAAVIAGTLTSAVFDKLDELGFIDKFVELGEEAGRSFWEAFIAARRAEWEFIKKLVELLGTFSAPPGFFEPEEKHSGGRIRGPVGAPRLISALAGETVLPLGSGGPNSSGHPMVIHLIMDRKVIGTASLEAFQKEARLKAGMVAGSLGS